MLRFLLFVLFSIAGSASAGDWTQFRGPNGTCVSDEKGLPTTWTKTEGHRWKVALPARGVSGLVVVGNTIYLTASSGKKDDRLHVLAFNLQHTQGSGEELQVIGGRRALPPFSQREAPVPEGPVCHLPNSLGGIGRYFKRVRLSRHGVPQCGLDLKILS